MVVLVVVATALVLVQAVPLVGVAAEEVEVTAAAQPQMRVEPLSGVVEAEAEPVMRQLQTLVA